MLKTLSFMIFSIPTVFIFTDNKKEVNSYKRVTRATIARTNNDVAEDEDEED